MPGILYVRMTNPDADCSEIGMGMGRSENIVTVGWKTTAATAVKQNICTAHSASQLAVHGTFSVQPTKFRGRLRSAEVVYPHGTTATPTAAYDIKLHYAGATAGAAKDLAASGLLNIPITNASQRGPEEFDPPIDIDDDIYLHVYNTGATSTGYKEGAIKLYFV